MGKIMYNGKPYSGSFDKAANISYDNSSSGLKAGSVQGAVDENANNIKGVKNKVEKNVLGAGVDLKGYTTTQYTFPKDGYVYLLLSYTANQYVYAEISGVSGSAIPIQISTGGDGHYGNTAVPVFVRAGMKFKIGMVSDLQYVTATYIPFA